MSSYTDRVSTRTDGRTWVARGLGVNRSRKTALDEVMLRSESAGEKICKKGLDNSGNIEGIFHIPSDLVVDQWASDIESNSHLDFLLLHDV
jgi:hypothetical protein